jgi:phosphoribosyl-AMP cyclohydrolase
MKVVHYALKKAIISAMSANFLDAVHWSGDGLVAAIAQDYATGDVLMMAWMNREALALTIAEERAVYWSRSKQRIWRKGEQSGNVQLVKAIDLDCDGDTLLLTVEQVGGIACHTGHRRCFFRRLQDNQWQAVEPVVKTPEQLYG